MQPYHVLMHSSRFLSLVWNRSNLLLLKRRKTEQEWYELKQYHYLKGVNGLLCRTVTGLLWLDLDFVVATIYSLSYATVTINEKTCGINFNYYREVFLYILCNFKAPTIASWKWNSKTNKYWMPASTLFHIIWKFQTCNFIFPCGSWKFDELPCTNCGYKPLGGGVLLWKQKFPF